MLAILGRLLFILPFVGGLVQKIQSFHAIAASLQSNWLFVQVFSHPEIKKLLTETHVPQELIYQGALGIMMVLLALGSLMVLFNSRSGYLLLATFLLTVTPIMHSFWLLPQGSESHQLEMVTFIKNLALLGACFIGFTGGRVHVQSPARSAQNNGQKKTKKDN